nr:MAG TPA: hypothetical protein [Caudoviricetes sp.]
MLIFTALWFYINSTFLRYHYNHFISPEQVVRQFIASGSCF